MSRVYGLTCVFISALLVGCATPIGVRNPSAIAVDGTSEQVQDAIVKYFFDANLTIDAQQSNKASGIIQTATIYPAPDCSYRLYMLVQAESTANPGTMIVNVKPQNVFCDNIGIDKPFVLAGRQNSTLQSVHNVVTGLESHLRSTFGEKVKVINTEPLCFDRSKCQ